MVLLLRIIYAISVLFCYAFMHVCLLMPWGHLLGKGCPPGSRLWCLIVTLSLSHWYLGSGVVFDCVDSWSLPFFLLCTLRDLYQELQKVLWSMILASGWVSGDSCCGNLCHLAVSLDNIFCDLVSVCQHSCVPLIDCFFCYMRARIKQKMNNLECNQTVLMARLIEIFAVCTC